MKVESCILTWIVLVLFAGGANLFVDFGKHSRSPPGRMLRSHSPAEKRSRSRSPVGRRSRSRTPVGRRSRSKSPFRTGVRWGGGSPVHRGGTRWGDAGRGGRRAWSGSKEHVCFNFQKGRCNRGISCRFLHMDASTVGLDRRGAFERDVGYGSKLRGSDRDRDREKERERERERGWVEGLGSESREGHDRGRKETSDCQREWNGNGLESRTVIQWRDKVSLVAPSHRRWVDREETMAGKSEREKDLLDPQRKQGECLGERATTPKQVWEETGVEGREAGWEVGRAATLKEDWESKRVMMPNEWDSDRSPATAESNERWGDGCVQGRVGEPVQKEQWVEERVDAGKEEPNVENMHGWASSPLPSLVSEACIEAQNNKMVYSHGMPQNQSGQTEELQGSSDKGGLMRSSLVMALNLPLDGSARHLPGSSGTGDIDVLDRAAVPLGNELHPPVPTNAYMQLPPVNDLPARIGDYNSPAAVKYGTHAPSVPLMIPQGGPQSLPIVIIPPLAPLPLSVNQMQPQQQVQHQPLHQLQQHPLQQVQLHLQQQAQQHSHQQGYQQTHHEVQQQPHQREMQLQHQTHHQVPLHTAEQLSVLIPPQQVGPSLPPPPHSRMQVIPSIGMSPLSSLPPPCPPPMVPTQFPACGGSATWPRPLPPQLQEEMPPPPPPMYIAQKPVEELYDPLADGMDDGSNTGAIAEEALLKDVVPLSHDVLGPVAAHEWKSTTEPPQVEASEVQMEESTAMAARAIAAGGTSSPAGAPTVRFIAADTLAVNQPGCNNNHHGDNDDDDDDDMMAMEIHKMEGLSPATGLQPKPESRAMMLLRNRVADVVKQLLKPTWKEGRMSRDAFKIIAKKAVDKVVGAIVPTAMPKNQRAVDAFFTVSRKDKIGKLVQVLYVIRIIIGAASGLRGMLMWHCLWSTWHADVALPLVYVALPLVYVTLLLVCVALLLVFIDDVAYATCLDC
ncbi:hypothetical protein CBR_g37886 [Chara braunii]|uniref:C3H1-type domain-containing protein n=1 Tax=Chara braunii TaxID=69332 RepID=A0A388LP80_CHABU|nr:hypothetical protein CBR_g37886 [Chara braunii]|eukprot:GBG84012.1 hypothetical protein CBR_g37886 [Chara braunii]